MQQAPSSLFSYVSLGGLIGSFLGFAAALVNFDVMSAGLESRVMWGIGAGILVGCILGYLVGSKSAKIATYKGAKNLSIALVIALGLCSGLYVTWEMRTSGVRLGDPAPAKTQKTQESPYWVITQDLAFAATSEDSMKEMLTHAEAKNVQAIQQMVLRGQVLALRKGTRLVMLDAGLGSHTVSVVDGPHSGKRCIVITEFIARDKP